MHSKMDLINSNDLELKTVVIGIVCSLSLLPITFHLTSSKSELSQTNLLAYFSTILVSIIILYVIHNILKHRCQSLDASHEKPLRNIFHVFSTSSYYANAEESFKEKEANSRRKIDPKYFKPKYIIHELMSMWGTTYTVITWGSVWIIGGTIVATEKLAQKIKTKCNRENSQDLNNNRSTGRNDSFTSYSSYASSNDSTTQRTNRSSLKRMRAWTKKSFASASKKFRKYVSSGVPQLTSPTTAINNIEPAAERQQ